MKLIKEASLELNGACNYSCPSCPQSAGRESEFLSHLPYDLFQKIILDLKAHGCSSVSLQGSGEPFLVKNIADYIRFASSNCINTHVITLVGTMVPWYHTAVVKNKSFGFLFWENFYHFFGHW